MNFKELRDKYGYEILCKYKLDIPYAENEEIFLNDKNISKAYIAVSKINGIAISSIVVSGELTMPMHKIKEAQILWIGEPVGIIHPNGYYEKGDSLTWTINISYYNLNFSAKIKKYIFGFGKKLWA